MALGFRRRRMGDEARALARVAAAERQRTGEDARVLDTAQAAMRSLLGGRPNPLHLGSALSSRREPFPVLLDSAEAWGGGHWAVTGATGAGKSYLALALLLQRLRQRFGGLVVVDLKGELAQLLRKVVLPSFIAEVGARDPEAALRLASKVAILAPFDPDAVPPFQVLARDRGLSIQEQAHEVASSFGRTIGRDLGVIQETVLRYALQLAIDAGYNLLDVARLLVDDDMRRAALERTQLEDVKHYFATRFPRERAGSVGSLLSRLDSLTMYPGLRRMLSAKGMVRLPVLIEDAVTIIDLGGAPAGMREVPQFLGQLFFQKLVRAIFARRVSLDGRTPPVTVVADEFQELLGPEVARDFERVLTLARSQRCFLWLLFQQAAQLEAVSPTLLRLLRTNTNYQAIFRSNIEDARHFSHVLPVTGRVVHETAGFPDPRQAERFLTADDERRELVELVPRMPDRLFWFCNRRAAYPTLLVRSPHFDVPGMRRRAEALPRELRDMVTRGVVALEPEAAGPGRGDDRAKPAATPGTGSGVTREAVGSRPPPPGERDAAAPDPTAADARPRRLSLG